MHVDEHDKPIKLLSFTFDRVIVGVQSHCAGVIVVLDTLLLREFGTVDMAVLFYHQNDFGVISADEIELADGPLLPYIVNDIRICPTL